MANEGALQEAQAQLAELIKAAKIGNIIPIRLPGQLEAIEALLAKAEEQHAEEMQKRAAAPDLEAYMKDQAAFLSHAVHELRTPMTSIRGYADMLNTPAMGELNDMQKQFLDTIRTNARRMESLLSDVSIINKLRANNLRLNQKMDMFKNIAMMIEKQMRPYAEELKRTLTFDIPQGLPLLTVDSELLTIALNKLVENAIRYSPEETGTVKVTGAAAGSDLVITIADNGIGITPEDLAQLGTLYFRSENEAVRAYKGSGTGIPIAYGLIELMGGSVSVESTVDVGTTFTIMLKGMT
ncbi:MAG: HAMP domain-containing histidine kinase [Chloroflexi bacterium]|nr:HAMP domain-containing histidine kinase [Chloroflexota bacterium]